MKSYIIMEKENKNKLLKNIYISRVEIIRLGV